MAKEAVNLFLAHPFNTSSSCTLTQTSQSLCLVRTMTICHRTPLPHMGAAEVPPTPSQGIQGLSFFPSTGWTQHRISKEQPHPEDT